MVNSAEEAERAVAACRYAPAGTRSFGPLTAMVRHGFQYLETANEQVACIPMIETVEAVERIDAILAVPGIAAVYVGPSDRHRVVDGKGVCGLDDFGVVSSI